MKEGDLLLVRVRLRNRLAALRLMEQYLFRGMLLKTKPYRAILPRNSRN